MEPLIASRLGLSEAQLKAFCEKHSIVRLSLFGSVVRDDFAPGSDIDVLVLLPINAGISLFDFTGMKEELEMLTGRNVDLVCEDAIENPFMRAEVNRTRKVVYDAAA